MVAGISVSMMEFLYRNIFIVKFYLLFRKQKDDPPHVLIHLFSIFLWRTYIESPIQQNNIFAEP